MAASQVVLYFDKQEDALLFTLAASSVISGDASGRPGEAQTKIVREISKASRITAESVEKRNAVEARSKAQMPPA